MTTDDLSHIEPGLRHLAVPIADLKPYPHQTNTHDERNLSAIARSLRVHGQKKSLVANLQGEVIAGWGTVLAAHQIGWTHLAVVFSEEDEKGLAEFHVEDNRTSELAKRDDQKLLRHLEGLAELGTTPEELGWNAEELSFLVFDTINETSTERKGQAVKTTLGVMSGAEMEFIQIGDLTIRIKKERYDRLREWLAESFENGRPYQDSIAVMIDAACQL